MARGLGSFSINCTFLPVVKIEAENEMGEEVSINGKALYRELRMLKVCPWFPRLGLRMEIGIGNSLMTGKKEDGLL